MPPKKVEEHSSSDSDDDRHDDGHGHSHGGHNHPQGHSHGGVACHGHAHGHGGGNHDDVWASSDDELLSDDDDHDHHHHVEPSQSMIEQLFANLPPYLESASKEEKETYVREAVRQFTQKRRERVDHQQHNLLDAYLSTVAKNYKPPYADLLDISM
jgi:hypothetical protein